MNGGALVQYEEYRETRIEEMKRKLGNYFQVEDNPIRVYTLDNEMLNQEIYFELTETVEKFKGRKSGDRSF